MGLAASPARSYLVSDLDHQLAGHLAGRFKQRERLRDARKGHDVMNHTLVQLEPAIAKIVRAERPLPAGEGRAVAHPAAGHPQLLAVQLLPLLPAECEIPVRRADAAERTMAGGDIKAQADGIGLAGGFKNVGKPTAACEGGGLFGKGRVRGYSLLWNAYGSHCRRHM